MDDLTDLPQALAGVKGRWITGAPALEAAPPAWRDLIGAEGENADDAELRLLALAGHALETAFSPTPDGDLTAAPPLPSLSLPCAPPGARARFRRVLASLKPDAAKTAQILTLAAARGWAVHPADWLPGKTDAAAPALYAPWVDWANDQTESANDSLSAETWDDWPPALRRAELTRLRGQDPAAARDLLAAKAGSVPADDRARLIALMSDSLSKDDAPFLQTLLKDRSSKVQNQAKRLLLRLGETEGADDAGAALAELCEVKRGLAGLGRKVVKLKSIKKARESKVFARFEAASLASLAAALELSPADLVAAWSLDGDAQVRDAFLRMVAETADVAARNALIERLIAEKLPHAAPDALVSGAPQDQRDRLIKAAVANADDHLAAAARFSGAELGVAPHATLRQSAVWSGIVSALDEELKAEKASWRREQALTQGLANLGLLADPDAAQALVDALIKRGAVAADPRLDMLYLNIALSPNAPSNPPSNTPPNTRSPA